MKIFGAFAILLIANTLWAQDSTRDIWDTGFIQKRPAGTTKSPDNKKAEHRYTKGSTTDGVGSPGQTVQPAFGITIWRLRVPASGDRDAARLLVQDSSIAKEYVAQRLEPSAVLRDGDRVRLGIEVPRTGFLYIVDREKYQDGSLGEPVLLFPTLNIAHADNRVEPGRLIEIPSEDSAVKALRITRSGPKHMGEDLIIIISPKPLEGVIAAQGEQILPVDLVETWERQWSVAGTRWDLADSSTMLWSVTEKRAASSQVLLKREDPPPAAIVTITPREDKSVLLIHFPLAIEH
jgi:hypothetical protein